jgi:hypothetical protein
MELLLTSQCMHPRTTAIILPRTRRRPARLPRSCLSTARIHPAARGSLSVPRWPQRRAPSKSMPCLSLWRTQPASLDFLPSTLTQSLSTPSGSRRCSSTDTTTPLGSVPTCEASFFLVASGPFRSGWRGRACRQPRRGTVLSVGGGHVSHLLLERLEDRHEQPTLGRLGRRPRVRAATAPAHIHPACKHHRLAHQLGHPALCILERIVNLVPAVEK